MPAFQPRQEISLPLDHLGDGGALAS